MANEIATFDAEQVDLIKRTICAGATNDELKLFINQCQRTGLDPFSRQIHAVKRGGRMTIQVGIDGFRLIAERTGQTDGQDGPFWCGEDGVWKDVWLSKEFPAACKVTVYRKGQARGYTGVARWSEFFQPQGGMWSRMPATMIAKVAESIALRKGFPQELSGLYAPEEMDQADVAHAHHAEPPKQLPPAQPPARDSSQLVRDFQQAYENCPDLPTFDAISQQVKADRRSHVLTDADCDQIRAVAVRVNNRLRVEQPQPAA